MKLSLLQLCQYSTLNKCTQMASDGIGQLFFGTTNGVITVNITKISIPAVLFPGKDVTSMVHDRNGILFFGCRQKVYKYNMISGANSLIYAAKVRCVPTAMDVDENGDLYVAECMIPTRRTMILKFDFASGRIEEFLPECPNGTCDGRIHEAKFSVIHKLACMNNEVYTLDSDTNVRKISDGFVSTVVHAEDDYQIPYDMVKLSQDILVVLSSNVAGELFHIIDTKKQTTQKIIRKLPPQCNLLTVLNNQILMLNTDQNRLYKCFDPWQQLRVVWIGKLKEKQSDCVLAWLPRELVKEILTQVLESYE